MVVSAIANSHGNQKYLVLAIPTLVTDTEIDRQLIKKRFRAAEAHFDEN